jgi:hypothetical protein
MTMVTVVAKRPSYQERSIMQDISAYCGLYCGACKIYLETRKGRSFLKKDEGEVKCLGCRTDAGTRWCINCTIKKCARNKRIDFCYECSDFPCEMLENFKNDKNYPYHIEIYDNLKIIEAQGEDKWLRQMKERWSCPECREQKCWYDIVCEDCNGKLNGYIYRNTQ